MYKRKRAGNTITRKINSTKDTAAKADKNHYISNSYLEGFIPIDTEYFTASIKPVLAPAVIMTTFTTFKQFDIVYLLTMQKGSYSGATLQTVITYAHQNAFVSNNYGLSSAVSIIIFLFIIIFSMFTNRGVKEV